MVHDPVPALTDHVLIGEHSGRHLQLLERVPVAPTEVGHLRHPRRRVVRAATSALAAAARRRTIAPLAVMLLLLRVRDVVLLAGGDLDGVRGRRGRRYRELEHLRERRLRGGGGGGGVGGDFLNVLGRLNLRGVLGRCGSGEVLDGIGRPLPPSPAEG
uniref:Uncharacterized protein n=1 Tax=Arundo donax TaxID=35708 RepID=A0A0A9ERZ2_ARUDO